MDPVSQGVLGAVAAQAVARNERAPLVGLLGGLSGMAPDLDVLVRSSHDPLLFLEVHRQFTHSLVFIPFGGLLCALLAFPFVRRGLSFKKTYISCVVGYATHGLLDACTSYGTQLLWPFSDLRVAWSNVSVIDPLFTLPLLIGAGLAAYRRSRTVARVACVWAVLYLSLGVVQRERAESLGLELALERGHAPARVFAKPSFGNLLLWKTFYEYDDRYYIDAARMGGVPKSFPGQATRKLDRGRDLPWLDPESQQAFDVERFRWFSGGYIALDPESADRVIDVRYSVIPNRIEALWGLRLSPTARRQDHAEFFTSRDLSPERREELLRMFSG